MFSKSVTVVTSGFTLHDKLPWLAASFDGEVIGHGNHDGVTEFKVAAADALAWYGGSSMVKDPPFGLHKQPPGAPPWSVYDHSSNSFVSAPPRMARAKCWTCQI